MFVSNINIYSQTPDSNNVNSKFQQSSYQSATKLQESLSLLEKENENMKAQLERLEKEIEFYRGDVRSKEANVNENLSHWLTLMALMIAVVGIVFPIVLNFMSVGNLNKKINTIEIQTKNAMIAASEAKASQLFSQALAEVDIKSAINLYTQLIGLNSKFSNAYNNRGNLYYKLKDYSSALDDYTRAINLDKTIAKYYSNRGLVYKSLGKYDRAIKDFNKAINLNPDSAAAYNNRAELWKDKNELDKAISDIEISLKINGKNSIPYITKGQIYMAKKAWMTAIDCFTTAISLNPQNEDIYRFRAECYDNLSMIEEGAAKGLEWFDKYRADIKMTEGKV